MEEKTVEIQAGTAKNVGLGRLHGGAADDTWSADLSNSEQADEPQGETEEEEDAEEAEKSTTVQGEKRSIYDLLEDEIMNSGLPDSDKARSLSRLLKLRGKTVNIMLTGATGSGKSSTINALFNMEVAKVGVSADPETMCISEYTLDNLILWDTPGLGDGPENDARITRDIIRKLNETNENNEPLIDMVIVILDASSKDLGTSYDLINNVLIPCLGDDVAKDRILVALNQSDVAMKGAHWDKEKNEPDEVLKDFLRKKAESVQARIKSATGLDIQPVWYCAGYKEDGCDQCKPYNLTKLLYFIVRAIPKDKRLAIADNLNEDKDNWRYDDQEDDYRGETNRRFRDTIRDCVSGGIELGVKVGKKILGVPGGIVGAAVGCATGTVVGFCSALFG